MNLINVVCVTVLFTLLMSSCVTSQSEKEKVLAQVLIGKYTREKDDFNSNISESRIVQKTYPKMDFGHNLTFTYVELNGNTTVGESVLALHYNFDKEKYYLKQWFFSNDSTIDSDGDDITIEQLVFGEKECYKKFYLNGTTYYGVFPACGRALNQNGCPNEPEFTLNCTHLTFHYKGKSAIYIRHGIYEAPGWLAPVKSLC